MTYEHVPYFCDFWQDRNRNRLELFKTKDLVIIQDSLRTLQTGSHEATEAQDRTEAGFKAQEPAAASASLFAGHNKACYIGAKMGKTVGNLLKAKAWK